MKGISTTLVIIVTAIVILVAALVVLTIFGEGISPIVDMTSKQNLCMSEYSILCSSRAITGQEKPPTWNAKVQVNLGTGTVQFCSCDQLVSGCSCSNGVASGCTPLNPTSCT